LNGIDTPPGLACEDHCGLDPDDEDDGDEWIKGIQACSGSHVEYNHTHIKIAVEEKQHKRKFF
jgi:hypothetical protein